MDVLAEYLAQRSMEQVRRGVIALGIAPPIARNDRARLAQLHFSRGLAERGDAAINLAHLVDVDAPSFALDLATVGDLATRLDIKRRLAQHYGDASVGKISLGDDVGADLERIVADERGRLVTLRPFAFAEHVLRDADFLGAAIFLRLR